MDKIYLKIHKGEFNNPTRDVRELLSAKEVGFKIKVLSGFNKFRGEEHSFERRQNENGIEIDYYTLKGWRKVFLIRMIKQYYAIAKIIKSYNADVISGHDIYALAMAYLSTLFIKKSKRPILIYDSHEFEIGRNEKRSKALYFIIYYLEKFLSRKCRINIMVNDSIADAVQEVHKLKERPLVVRSIPNYWEIDKEIIKTRREEILNKLNADKNSFIIIYHGAIMEYRGIEQVIKTISKRRDMIFVVMGYVLEEDYLQEVQNKVKENNLEDRFLLLPKMPADRIWEYTGAADVGIMLIQDVGKSYELCLPNKFFETIQSETPILSSKLVEMEKLIRRYNIGLTCNHNEVMEIEDKLIEMKNNKEKYKEYKENLKIAKKELCWENEKKIFIKAFKELYDEII